MLSIDKQGSQKSGWLWTPSPSEADKNVGLHHASIAIGGKAFQLYKCETPVTGRVEIHTGHGPLEFEKPNDVEVVS